MDERRENVLAGFVVDQDLVNFFVRHSCRRVHRLIQIQHPDYAFCLFLPEIESHFLCRFSDALIGGGGGEVIGCNEGRGG